MHPLARIPLCTALLAGMKNYSAATLRQDVLAGLAVALIAMPLAMALGIAVGLPPQYGIYTAVVAGILTPLLGGSVWQVTGPTAAFIAILAPIVAKYGLDGLLWCGMLAGGMILLMGIFRLGRFIEHMPHMIVTGFTSGIALVIAFISLNDLFGLGLTLNGSFLHKLSLMLQNLSAFHLADCATGLLTILVMIAGRRLPVYMPGALLALCAATLLGLLLTHMGHAPIAIGDRFFYTTPDGVQHPGIAPHMPSPHMLAFPGMEQLLHYIYPAIAIALLASLESLLSATVADKLAGGKTKHDPNAELNAIGIANITTAFFTGIPAAGAITRTAASITSGGKTPLASSFHGVFILIFVLLLAPLLRYIPMSALSGLLIYVAWRMAQLPEFLHLIRTGPKKETVVLLTTFTLTMLQDMVAGVAAGIVLALILKVAKGRNIAE